MLAYGVSDTFRLYLPCASVGAFRRVPVYVVQRRVGDLMDSGLYVLKLAHSLVDRYALPVIKAASLYCTLQRFKAHSKGGSPFKGSKKVPVLLHVARQFVIRNARYLFPLGL